jgi:hypothetical protein
MILPLRGVWTGLAAGACGASIWDQKKERTRLRAESRTRVSEDAAARRPAGHAGGHERRGTAETARVSSVARGVDRTGAPARLPGPGTLEPALRPVPAARVFRTRRRSGRAPSGPGGGCGFFGAGMPPPAGCRDGGEIAAAPGERPAPRQGRQAATRPICSSLSSTWWAQWSTSTSFVSSLSSGLSGTS